MVLNAILSQNEIDILSLMKTFELKKKMRRSKLQNQVYL